MSEKIFFCSECGDEISEGRYNLGYDLCLACGEREARKETKKKSKRVALAYNKGPYTYTTPNDNPKALGKK